MLNRTLPVFALVLTAALHLAAPLALADPAPALLTVTGDGISDAVPDLAVLTIGVTTTGDTAATALAQNSAALAAVLERLRAAGVADRDGEVLDAAVADGANTLNGLSFGQEDPRPAMDAARRAAVKDASAKAELYAEAAGVTLGRIVSIAEGGGYGGPAPMYDSAKSPAGSVPIAAGELSLTASVTVVWELAD
ncbi:MAG: SIMPL domain-containing protein [Rhodobacter sp.]|nr:SIMPL domain-containing protein [Rhodobacter sp.]